MGYNPVVERIYVFLVSENVKTQKKSLKKIQEQIFKKGKVRMRGKKTFLYSTWLSSSTNYYKTTIKVNKIKGLEKKASSTFAAFSSTQQHYSVGNGVLLNS